MLRKQENEKNAKKLKEEEEDNNKSRRYISCVVSAFCMAVLNRINRSLYRLRNKFLAQNQKNFLFYSLSVEFESDICYRGVCSKNTKVYTLNDVKRRTECSV